jgi:hypothetical protein
MDYCYLLLLILLFESITKEMLPKWTYEDFFSIQACIHL